MTVFAISEENHGFIGVVKTADRIIDFLVENDWLAEYSDTYDENIGRWVSIEEKFGENWHEVLAKKNLEELSNIFNGSFYFEEYRLYE